MLLLRCILLKFSLKFLSRCREEANKNVDDFGFKPVNANANNSGGESGQSWNRLSPTCRRYFAPFCNFRFAMATIKDALLRHASNALCVKLFRYVCCLLFQNPTSVRHKLQPRHQRNQSPNRAFIMPTNVSQKHKSNQKGNGRRCRKMTWLRLALKSNLIRSIPLMSLGFIMLEAIRCLYLCLRKRSKRQGKTLLGGNCGANSSLETASQYNFNNNGDTNPDKIVAARSANESTTNVPDDTDTTQPHNPWLALAFMGALDGKKKSTTSKLKKHRSTAATIVQDPSNMDSRVYTDNDEDDGTRFATATPSTIRKITINEFDDVDDNDDYDYDERDDDYERLLWEEKTMSESVGVIIMTMVLLVIYTVAGACIVSTFENWSYFTGAWFLFMSIITVGYGDVIPSSSMYLTYFIPYIVLGMSIFGNLMGLAMLFFNNLTSKIRVIGNSYFDVYSAKTQIHKITKKSRRARKWWRFLRMHISNGLPRKLIEESQDYKLALFGRERNFIKDAFRIYFKRVYEDKLKERELFRALPERTSQFKLSRMFSRSSSRQSSSPATPRLPLWRRFKSSVSRMYSRFRVYMSPGENWYQ